MLRRFFNWKNSARRRSSNHLARRSHSRRQTLSRIAALAAEALEPRTVMAAFTYVDDSWSLTYDVDQSGDLTNGDVVSSGSIAATYGSTAFGTVIGQPGVLGSQTIADAINNTDAGGTLRILEGSYTEDLAIAKNLSIVGDGASLVTLNGTTTAIAIAANSNVAIDGLAIVGGTTGVSVDGASATVALTNSRIAGAGIGVASSNGGSITAFSGNDFEAQVNTANGVDLSIAATSGPVTVGGNNKFGATQFFVDNQLTQDLDLTAAGNTFESLSNFDIEDKIHHVVDNDLALTNGLVTWVSGNIYVTNPTEVGSTDSSIQRGIDIAAAGNTVNVEAGTYVEAVTLNKSLTLLGAGNGDAATDTIITSAGVIANITASGVTVRNLRVSGGTRGIQVGGVSNTLLDTIAAVGVGGLGIGVEVGGPATNVEILNSLLSGNSVGLRMGTAASLDGLTVTDSAISNNNQGIFVAVNNPSTSYLKNVDFSNTVISDNLNKGAYFEKLQDATFTNITVTNNGTNTAYSFNAGFDINLKYGNYSNISFVDSTFTDNGIGATSPAFPGYGLAIKARNDAPSYSSNPASLSGVTLTNVTINATAATPASVAGLAIGNNVDLDTVALTNVDLGGAGSIGLSVFGASAGDTLSLGDTNFAADLTGYVVNQSAGVIVDGTAATYGGVAGGIGLATLDALAIADKVVDNVDVATFGKVVLRSGHVYVTPNSFFAPLSTTPSIQRGVDAANAMDTVHVGAGEYVDDLVNINKQITLSGANAGMSAKGQANRDARGPESLLQHSALGSLGGINVTAAGVIIDGLAFKGAGTTGSDQTHIYVGAPNVTIRNILSNSDINDPFSVPGGNARGIVLSANYDGFRLEQSFFARQRTGVFVNPGSGTNTLTFDNNEFASRTGINHDEGFANLNSTITNNIFAKVDVDGYDYGPNTGVNVAVVPNGGSVVFTGNQIASNNIGVDLKNVQSGGSVNFDTNTFTDHTQVATGVKVNAAAGASVTFTGNTFANGGAFVWNVGPASLDLSTGGNQVDVGSGAVELASADLATAFATADKVIDGIDTGNSGMVRLQAGKVFVTPNSFLAPTTTAPSIQRGVDYAAVNDEVHVAAGTYTLTGTVVVNKSVSLLGAQAGVDARTRTAVPETVVVGAGGSFSLGADNVTLDGFTIQSQTGLPLGTGIHAVATASGHQIRNNIIQDNVIGLYFGSSGAIQSVVEQNLFLDNNNAGAAGGTALYSDQGVSNALIRNNTFTGDNFTAAINLIGATTAVSSVSVTGNAFETGNQLVLFNVDNSTVSNNTFSGELPSGGAGTGVFIGGGSDGLTVSGNTFTDRASGAISASDFGYGPNTNLTISGNTISQNVNLLPAGRSMISLTDVQGASVTDNSITLSGTIGAPVTFVHAINIAGAATDNVNVSANDLFGLNNGGSAGVRLRNTLSASATIDVANNKINGFDHGVLADALATGIDVDINGNDLSDNALFAVTNGAGELLDASGNWLGSNTPSGAAAAVSGAVDFSPWLNVATDTDNGERGFQGDFSVLHVDDNSPQAPGYAGRIDEALNLLANSGTLFLHAGTYNENVSTAAKAVTLELGNGTAGVSINGSLTLDADDTLHLDLGTFASDQLDVSGNVVFGNATLTVTSLQPLTANSLLLLARRGGGSDTFGNVIQGQQLVVGGQTITARYDLGDGNDFGFLTASNPVITDISGPVTYVENADPILLSPGANLTDLDNINMNGGSLQVVITSGGDATDRIIIRNVGTGAGEIGVSGNTITYGGVVIGTFTGGTGTTQLQITFTNDGAATLQAVQALLRNIAYSSVSESPAGPKELAYVLQDGSGGVGAAVQEINITPVADNPFVSPNGQSNFTENSAPIVLAPISYVSDVDSMHFAGGTLIVAITNNAQAADQLGILNAGAGPGQIGVSGNDITFEGVLIGTFSGGNGTTPLVISLNGSATVAVTTALLRSITFVTPGDNPAATYRTVSFQLNDGTGGLSNVATKLVRVITVNDAPSVSMQLSKNYQAGATPILLSPSSAVTDPDSWSFSGGTLTVSVGNADAGDRVGIQSVGTGAGQISVSGSQVLYEGVVIGTFTGGSGSTPLVVSFNASATRVGVQAVVRSINFSTVSSAAPRGLRNVNFVVTDGDGGTSATATKPVYVVAPSASATLASSSIRLSGGQSVSYSRNGIAVAVLPRGVVSGSPAKGKLTVSNASGQAADRLTIGGRFAVSQRMLLLNGIAVGTVNAGGGFGKTSLVISLNDKATQSLVQELVRSIKFQTAAHAAQTARAVSFTLAAADGTKANTSSIVQVR